MGKSRISTKKKVISFITLIILAVVIFFALLFDNSSYSAKSYEFSADVLNKVVSAQKAGSTVEFNAKELNEALSAAFKKSKTVGNITIKGMNVDITESTLKFYTPITYKGFNFLMTSEGKVYLKDKNIVYEPSYFKLGKIKMPQSYALKKLNGKFNGMLKAQNNTLNVDTKLVPMNMKSIEVKNKQLVIHIDEKAMDIKQRLEWFNNLTKSGSGMEKLSKYINSTEINKIMDKVSPQGASTQNSNGSKNNNETPSKTTTQTQKGSNNSESTGDADQVISDILSAVSSHDKSAMSRIQAEYNNLSSEQKAKVESAVSSSLDEKTKNALMKKIK